MAKKKSDAAAEGAAAGKKAPAAKAPAAAAAKKSAATGAKKPAAGAAAAAPAKKPAAAAGTVPASAAPVIDTSLAANAAAAMIASKVAQGAPAASSGQPAKKESGAFKQLKAGLNKPAAAPLGGAFGVPQTSKKSPLPFGGGKQVGHNQTFGADVNRTGVPRRTPG
jgi:hypothetical protein